MRHPLVILTITFCAGILVGREIRAPFLCLYGLSVLFLVLSILFSKKQMLCDIGLSILVFLLGMGLYVNQSIVPQNHISRLFLYNTNQLCLLEGYIEEDPQVTHTDTSFVMRVHLIGNARLRQKCCGKVLVHSKGKKELKYGDGISIRGYLVSPYLPSGPNSFNYRNYLLSQGIYYLVRVKNNSDITLLTRKKSFWVKRLSLVLKSKIERVFYEQVSYGAAGILDAMVLGEKRNISVMTKNSFVKSGTAHILVVSGFNVGIVVYIVLLSLKLLRLGRTICLCAAIPLVIVYSFMTGASTPVVRAAIMSIVLMGSALLKREPDIYNSLALAAFCILAVSPNQLFDIGFELSFVSVLSIVFLYPRMKALLRIDTIKIRFLRYLLDAFLVSLAAWFGTMGLIGYYFKIFSPVTVLANIVIVPLASLITLCGFSLLLAVYVFPCLAPFFARSNEFAVALLLHSNNLFIKIPGAFFYLR
ncbi:MAG: ComEC/Rec2 family competence protein [Candidatus Omnitrophota bacterium]|jgi:competence protein ComEC